MIIRLGNQIFHIGLIQGGINGDPPILYTIGLRPLPIGPETISERLTDAVPFVVVAEQLSVLLIRTVVFKQDHRCYSVLIGLEHHTVQPFRCGSIVRIIRLGIQVDTGHSNSDRIQCLKTIRLGCAAIGEIAASHDRTDLLSGG
ncbi:hypothetical protein D3C73_1174820 [compost metagenome]